MKKRNTPYSMPGLLLMAFLLTAFPVLADIYSWTDENGVRHYSDTPPGDSSKVRVANEILHDQEADQRKRDAHQQMVQQADKEQRGSENRELEERLKKAEKQLQAAERKADRALVEAKEARTIAEEKQRRREVYVVPWVGPINKRDPRPVPYQPYLNNTPPYRIGSSNSQ